MTKQDIVQTAVDFTDNSELNSISPETAVSPELAGLRIFDPPIFAFAGADNPGFEELKKDGAVGPHMLSPAEWLPQARTVISFFLPFTKEVRESNRRAMSWPSYGWLHGRIEGHAYLTALADLLRDRIVSAGYLCVIPPSDPRYDPGDDMPPYSSRWSERHVGYVCGLGTFGLSGGIITEKGMAGRLGSLVTSLELEPGTPGCGDIYANCVRCGKCARNCPAGAISKENGKDNAKCSAFLDSVMEKHKPRYGCGKCQVNVPCEDKIPGRKV